MRLRRLVAAVLSLGLAVCLSGQDLAGAAKKEKERREKLKNKAATVVTNSDLAKIKKKAAVENAAQPRTEMQTEGQAPPDGEEGSPPEPAKKPTAVGAEPGKGLRVAEAEADAEIRRAELQEKFDRAKERVEFLTLKMRALQQQFFSFNTMQSKEQVQKEIVETNLKLQAATAEEAALKKEFDEFSAKNPIKK
ncbi:MAG: hypothetical protein JW843_07165 [Candidatus Aminicenantes bacterium]|nr:hypothetical protein [Candidatus Aminicenantes bacterium]